MIQAQRAIAAHVVADQPDKSLQTLGDHGFRILRRNAPTLAFERQRIGRRADFGAETIAALIHPGF